MHICQQKAMILAYLGARLANLFVLLYYLNQPELLNSSHNAFL